MAASLTEGFDRFCLLDSHDYPQNSHTTGNNCYRLLIGLGKQKEIVVRENPLAELQSFLDLNKSNWYFGHLNYDLKNNIESRLISTHNDPIGFPVLSFFIPEIVFAVQNDVVTLWFTDKTNAIIENIKLHINSFNLIQANSNDVISNKTDFIIPNKQEYLKAIESKDSIADAYCNLGILESQDKNYSKAIDCFTLCLKEDPRHFEAHYNLANLYAEIGNFMFALRAT